MGQRPGPLAIADFTRDGHADLALTRNTSATYGGEIMVFAGNGAGAFAAPIRTELPFEPSVTRLTDANGDGKCDLLMSTSYSVGVALGHGDGTFVVSRVDNDVTPRDLAVGDSRRSSPTSTGRRRRAATRVTCTRNCLCRLRQCIS